MPYGAFVNALPPAFFLAVHLVGFLVGAFSAYRAFDRTAALLGWGFSLYALAELVYMTYHLDCEPRSSSPTPFSEVLDLVAFVLIFAGASRSLIVRSSTTHAAMVQPVR